MVVEAPRYLGTGEGQTPILSGGDKRFVCRNECPSKVRLALLARGGGMGTSTRLDIPAYAQIRGHAYTYVHVEVGGRMYVYKYGCLHIHTNKRTLTHVHVYEESGFR